LSPGVPAENDKLKTVIKSVEQGGIADTLGLVKKGKRSFVWNFFYLYFCITNAYIPFMSKFGSLSTSYDVTLS